MPAVSIIIVSYNCKRLILQCIDSICRETTRTDFEIIVVDNASVDGTPEALSQVFPQVRLVRLPENVGFGRGCNAGAAQAAGNWILLLNPDAIVLPDAIDRLLRFAQDHPDAGIWGGHIVNPDGSIANGSCWRFPSLWSTFCTVAGLARAFPRSDFFNRESYGGWQHDSIRQVDVICGCLLLISRTLWGRLEGFDPVYFMYSEEVDLCLRAQALGARPLVSPDVGVVHYVGGTQAVPTDRLVLRFKGQITYMLRHWSPWRRQLGKLLLLCLPLSRYLSFRLLASLPGGRKALPKAQAWRDVWHRRDVWLPGYPG